MEHLSRPSILVLAALFFVVHVLFLAVKKYFEYRVRCTWPCPIIFSLLTESRQMPNLANAMAARLLRSFQIGGLSALTA